MSDSLPRTPADGPTPLATTLGVAAAAVAATCVILLGFSWPALTAEPREIPVAVTGEAALVERIGATVEQAGQDPAPVDLIEVDDRAAAVTAIEEREVVGAVLLKPGAPEILTASAAGSGPGQVMNRLAERVRTSSARAAQAPAEVTVTDVVPYAASDPVGMRLAAAELPLVIGGLLGGALIGLLVRGTGRQLIALGGYAVIGGFALGALLHFWYGALPGPYGLVALALSLSLLAVGAVVLGLVRLLGAPGVSLGAVFFVLGANPISGAAVPRGFLPGPWDTIGGWLPPGAAGDLLRNLCYFPDAATAVPWLILAGWAAVGLHLVLLSVLRFRPAPAELDATTAANGAAEAHPT